MPAQHAERGGREGGERADLAEVDVPELEAPLERHLRRAAIRGEGRLGFRIFGNFLICFRKFD